jgi:hypothetical protein
VSQILYGCTTCGAQIITTSIPEAVAWDKEHRLHCPPPEDVQVEGEVL